MCGTSRQESEKRAQKPIGYKAHMYYLGFAFLAWFLWPVAWVLQKQPQLSQFDWKTHVMAFKEYGWPFLLVVGVLNLLLYVASVIGKVRYLSMPAEKGERPKSS